MNLFVIITLIHIETCGTIIPILLDIALCILIPFEGSII